MSMQFICTIQRSASGELTSGKSTSREPPPRGWVRKVRVGIQDGIPFGACFWKYTSPSAPYGERFIVNGRLRRCGTSTGAIAR